MVQAGGRISLTLTNTDEMPHNWVLAGWFTYELVGQSADHKANTHRVLIIRIITISRNLLLLTAREMLSLAISVSFSFFVSLLAS